MDYHRPSPLDVESGREMANDHAPMAHRRLKISIALAALAALALCVVFSGYGGTSGSAMHSIDETVGQSISLAEALCSDISGSYMRSSDQALIKIEQTGCVAQFTRVNGTVGRPASSATLRGTKVMPYQSEPGRVQENGDIRFLSGVVYAKIKDSDDCSDISGAYIRSGDRVLFAVKQKGCVARFKCVNGTVGCRAYSATVRGTKVTRSQSAPGDVQENGDIRFLSGIVYAKIECSDISGAYMRSGDQSVFVVQQKGCAAQFRRLNGTVGDPAFSAAVIGTKVMRRQSAPGDVQENGNIQFLSGVVYAKIKECSNISGSYIRSRDQALIAVTQKGCAAQFTRVKDRGRGRGRGYLSAAVIGTKVARHQSAPGNVQENGDIRFLSGVVYARSTP